MGFTSSFEADGNRVEFDSSKPQGQKQTVTPVKKGKK